MKQKYQKIIIAVLILFSHVFFIRQRKTDKQYFERNIDKLLKEQTELLNKNILNLNSKTDTFIKRNKQTENKIKSFEQSIEKIKNTQTKIRYEKDKNKIDINDASAYSDWLWFQSKFTDKR